MPSAGVNSGIGCAFADAIVLPIAPDYLIRIVDWLAFLGTPRIR
jgi:hypothetical protein